MHRTLEALFRQPLRFLVLLVLLPVIAVGVEYKSTPRMYQSTASLWALHRYIIIGATGPETNLEATPADTQTAALGELLQTEDFTLKIARMTDLVSTLKLSKSVLLYPQLVAGAEFLELAHNVKVASQGYNLYSISYANRNPEMAQRVVQAVITTFAVQSQSFSAVEAQQLLATYQTQLAQSRQEVDRITNEELKYISAHANLNQTGLAADPQYAQLQAQAQQAQTSVTQIQNNIATINDEIGAQGSGTDGLLQVLDPPQWGIATSRTRSFIIGGIAGLAMALLACTTYLIILVRRDTTIADATGLPDTAAFPVLLQLPPLRAGDQQLIRLVRSSVVLKARKDRNPSVVDGDRETGGSVEAGYAARTVNALGPAEMES